MAEPQNVLAEVGDRQAQTMETMLTGTGVIPKAKQRPGAMEEVMCLISAFTVGMLWRRRNGWHSPGKMPWAETGIVSLDMK